MGTLTDVWTWVEQHGATAATGMSALALLAAIRANSHSKTANRIAKEALDYQKRQGEPELLVEPKLDFPADGDCDDPLSGSIVVTIKNVGAADARVAGIAIKCHEGPGITIGHLWGDLTERGRTNFPFTLPAGRVCYYRFHQFYKDEAIPLRSQWGRPDYRGQRGDWMYAQRVVVLASNREFVSQDNTALARISEVLWNELREQQEKYNASIASPNQTS